MIIVQPFIDMPPELSTDVFKQLRKICPKIYLRKEIALPQKAFYSKRNRYRADSLILFLSRLTHDDTVIIALTTKDIIPLAFIL